MSRGRPGSAGGKFDIGNILGDPFALATISIAVIAWLIAFISMLLAISAKDLSTSELPKFSWWTIAYELFCIIFVSFVVSIDSVQKYNVAIVGFLGPGLVFTCSSSNNFVYNVRATVEAAGAGHILLSIIQMIWIFYFGSSPSSSYSSHYSDSFALHKDSKHHSHLHPGSRSPLDRPHTSTSSHPPQMYTSAQLNGFETSSPVLGGDYRSSMAKYNGGAGTPQPVGGSQAMAEEVQGMPTEYNYRAKAIYSYDANPEDVNEISFQKGEILEVSDVSGRWWQARKDNGETGIAPSNYLILL